jgi:hypothetical protein
MSRTGAAAVQKKIPRNWADIDFDESTVKALPLPAFKRHEIRSLNDIPEFISPKDLAIKLSMGYSTLMRHIKQKLLFAQPLRRGYRIPLWAVGEYLERLEMISRNPR